MKDTMGIILANNETIPPITDNRAVLALLVSLLAVFNIQVG